MGIEESFENLKKAIQEFEKSIEPFIQKGRCKNCKYGSGNGNQCHYNIITGKIRGCSAKDCTKFEERQQK